LRRACRTRMIDQSACIRQRVRAGIGMGAAISPAPTAYPSQSFGFRPDRLDRRETSRLAVTVQQSFKEKRANYSAVGSQGPQREVEEVELAGPEGEPAAGRRVHPRVHHHPEEAELG